MSRLRGAVLLLAATVLSVTPALAQVAGHPIELSGGAGFFHFDTRTETKDAPGFTASLGWRYMPVVSLEATGLYTSSKADFGSEPKRQFLYAGLDARWNLRPADGHAVPFILTGLGYGKSHWDGDAAANGVGQINADLARGSGSVGLGLLVNLADQRTFLRAQVRTLFFQERTYSGLADHTAVTIGLQRLFGGKPRDQDLDGVRDWLDQCPDTPIGAKVDARGCPIDSDGDGVYDGLDKCENTPKGCKVDMNGCPIDSDGDGVCDGLDQCPDTPKGAKVDAHGCPIDSDGDGVYDGLDKCENTPKGCTIDANGCPSDADGDGVCDGLDLCPNTPAGLRVDAHGCPIEVSEKEVQLLDTGTIRLGNVQFDTGKATLKPQSSAVLDSIAAILQQYPTLKIEVGGHTDSQGTLKKNQVLSEDRAKAVFGYLRTKVPGFDSLGYTSKGYGPTVPIAPNSTALGRAKNRRVEFKVMNTEALRIERQRRRYLKKDEGAAPAPPPAPMPALPPAPKPAPRDTMPVPILAPPDTTQH
jgi:outer membrane protein OmpA-like peptidoglycan-associated protein